MTKLPTFRRAGLLKAGLCFLLTALSLAAQDQTVNGHLAVTGTLDVSGNQFTLGSQSGSYGAGFFYFDADSDTLHFKLNRTVASWLWENGTSSAVPGMRLDSAHSLLLYNADGSAAGLTLNPVSSTITFGDVTLYRSASGMLRTSGGITVDGAFSSASFTSSGGNVTGGTTGLTLNAGGTDQSVSLNPSGSGSVNIASGGSTGSVVLGNAGVATFTGHIRPQVHNTFDLGASGQRWRNAYVQGTTTTGSVVVESGAIQGGAAGLAVNAGGTDQSLTLAATGTGTVQVAVNGAEAARFAANGRFLLGTAADAANGRLQLAAHTTAAGGIGFGTDTVLYRSAAGTLKTDGNLTVTGNARVDGAVRIAPQGDLSMGEFTNEP